MCIQLFCYVHVVYCVFQSTPRCHQREATLVFGEVPTEVAAEEERAQGAQLLRAVTRPEEPSCARNSECSSAFTHTLTQGSIDNNQFIFYPSVASF